MGLHYREIGPDLCGKLDATTLQPACIYTISHIGNLKRFPVNLAKKLRFLQDDRKSQMLTHNFLIMSYHGEWSHF